jgi:hypothetical protein
MRIGVLAALVALAPCSAGATECRLDGRAWIVGRVGAGPLARAVDARRGEAVRAFVVAPGTLDGRKVLFSAAGERGFTRWPAACGESEVRWRRVEPTMEHLHTPAPAENRARGLATYSNAVLFGPRHGTWIGYDAIEYFETPLDGPTGESGWSRAIADARPSSPELDVHDGLGVMRLAATVRAGGRSASTPGAADRDGPGISDKVFRYTYRSGDDFLGWLTSWFNVPYLFGSAGHREKAQAERYVGADCADVLVGALRRAGRRDLDYSSVADLVTKAHRVAGPVVVDGESGQRQQQQLRVGTEVRPGDLLVIDYVGWTGTPRAWDHILVFAEDRGPDGKPDGVLGPEDLVADSGDAVGLVFQPRGKQGKVNLLVLRVETKHPGGS